MGVLERLHRWERATRPTDPDFTAAMARRWAELPEIVRTPGQALGRFAVGCEGTHGVFPPCDLACTSCYHSRGHRGKGRAGLRTKSRLVVEPVEADLVRRICTLRVGERLGYQAIADRLNTDTALNPAPTPPDPARAAGRWTPGSVRDVLSQPKYTGYMVWNRRAMKTRAGSPNPIEEWVWSGRPTHEPIIDMDTFVAAQKVARRRERSRTAAGPNAHPHTKRSYLLRSHLFCALCGRRMFGKTRRAHAYYACAPKKDQPVPDGHPASLWVNEAALVDGLHEFLAEQVFGSYRRTLLADTVARIDKDARAAHPAGRRHGEGRPRQRAQPPTAAARPRGHRRPRPRTDARHHHPPRRARLRAPRADRRAQAARRAGTPAAQP
jgi:hypothetical protein